MKLLKVDWEDLEEAFQDGSGEHRYYLDRETGQVLFFSAYLDSDDEQEQERQLACQERYVPIPLPQRLPPFGEVRRFVGSLSEERVRRLLAASLPIEGGQEAYERFSETVDALPETREKWARFQAELLRRRMVEWLAEIGVQPLD